jgi:hypothetical protein
MPATELIFWFGLIFSIVYIVSLTVDHILEMEKRKLILRAKLYRAAANARRAEAVRRAVGDVWSRRARTVEDLVGRDTSPHDEWEDWGTP